MKVVEEAVEEVAAAEAVEAEAPTVAEAVQQRAVRTAASAVRCGATPPNRAPLPLCHAMPVGRRLLLRRSAVATLERRAATSCEQAHGRWRCRLKPRSPWMGLCRRWEG